MFPQYQMLKGTAMAGRHMSSNPVDDVNKFISDPDRMKAALLTHGVSESARFVQNESQQLTPDAPDMEKPPKPPSSTDASVLEAQAAETARAKKGRAANLLSPGQSLGSMPLSLSRRTLLGS